MNEFKLMVTGFTLAVNLYNQVKRVRSIKTRGKKS